MIRCGECGCSVTAEEKINRHGYHYTYYHCSKRRPDYRCHQPYISIRNLEQQIIGFLEEVTVPENIHRWAVRNHWRFRKRNSKDVRAHSRVFFSLVPRPRAGINRRQPSLRVLL